MAESMKGLKRSHRCTEVTKAEIGSTVTLMGWVQKSRNKGGIVFVDLRDRSGIMQIIFENGDIDEQGFEKAGRLRSEFVIAVKGRVEARSGAVNSNLSTGEIEVRATELRILSEAETPPFPIEENSKTRDEVRLKYRYLDLRRPDLQKNMMLRSQVSTLVRQFLAKEGFLEIETPTLIKSTPEGARDYLVPSRVHPGSFYALPQSPQIFKQLLMCSGYDRYFQIARCYRDEDLRADRQPEFTQIDMELSFVDVEDVLDVNERMLAFLFKEVLGVEVQLPIERMTWIDAMNRFGSDKPDLRFGMELTDVSEVVKDCEFVVFKGALENGGSVRGINAKGQGAMPRKKIDKLVEFAKGYGAKGLAYVRWADETPNCSFAKFLKEGELDELLSSLGAEKGDCVFIVSDKTSLALSVMGALRLTVAKTLNIIPENKWNFLWITEMPFFEYDEESGEWLAMHHPFTMPLEECIPYLDTDKSKVRAEAFDLVLNGTELSSGSMRITDCELQNKMFELLGMEQEEIDAKFGFLVEAYKYAAPPHGGMGIGLDRLAMLICGADSLRDVTAFPKVQNASELMSGAPSNIDDIQLGELGINILNEDKEQ